jgi:hypothetical protein
MEDLKKYLAILAKHSFWILTGLVLILSAVFFYLTKSSLDQSIDARKSTLKSTFEKIRGVEGKVSTHPNDYSHKEMEKLLSGLKEDVDQAWEFQYARQKEFLTWPSEAFYQEKTRRVFESLSPFEGIVPFPIPTPAPAPMDAITRNDRTVYKNYIAPEFPNLARRIGSTWKFELDPSKVQTRPGMGGSGRGPGEFTPDSDNAPGTTMQLEETRDLVRWSVASQEALAAGVLPWFNRAEPPDIHEIYYAQEDIWILRGLMDIIAKTNAGSKENFQAIVKEIEWIVTGPRATRDAGTLWKTMIGSSGGAGGFGQAGAFSGKAAGGGRGESGMSKFEDSTVRVDPADGRYVDANLKPLTGAQLRNAIRAKTPDAVAKRVQVRMRLKVDERFGRLITECGNGKMMLEVLQVRYNTPSAIDSMGSGGSGFGGGGGFGRGGGAGLKKGMASGEGINQNENLSGSSPTPQDANVNSGEVSIEIYGLIYLFNPPSNLSEKAASPAEEATTAAAAEPEATGNTAAEANRPEADNVPDPTPTQDQPPTEEMDPPAPADPSAVEPDPSAPESGDNVPPPPADAPGNDGGGKP